MKEETSLSVKALLTLEEASAYFNIGVCKIRELTNDENCPYVLWNGSKRLIKRNDYLKKTGFKDIVQHKAGEQIEVDWAGVRPYWQDPDSGEKVYGWLFAEVLPFSGLGFAYVTPDMKMPSWIQCQLCNFYLQRLNWKCGYFNFSSSSDIFCFRNACIALSRSWHVSKEAL